MTGQRYFELSERTVPLVQNCPFIPGAKHGMILFSKNPCRICLHFLKNFLSYSLGLVLACVTKKKIAFPFLSDPQSSCTADMALGSRGWAARGGSRGRGGARRWGGQGWLWPLPSLWRLLGPMWMSENS